tara:strand:- start:1579 stop:2751 length:1173 start_codon:yes stop_codon:yes gene_type:complete
VKVWSRLALVLGACLFAGVMVEIGLRLLDYSRPVFYRYDEILGADLRPNVAGYFKKEDLIYVRLNEDSMRGPLRHRKKPPSTRRVAVLGDSFTEGFQVNFENLFTTVLERELARCAPKGLSAEVLNFGVSGFGTARAILKYREQARHYDPDVVLLMFYPGNDYADNHRQLEQNPLLPYFVMKGDELVLDDGFRSLEKFQTKLKYSNFRNAIVNWSRMLQLVNEVIVAWKSGGLFERYGDRDLEPEPVPLPYIDPVEPVWREARNVTDHMLNRLAAEVESEGRLFVLANVVSGSETHRDPALRSAWDAAQRGAGFMGEEIRLRDLAQDSGFQFIGLLAPLREYVDRSGDDLFFFEYLNRSGGHWNKIGHHVVGTVLAEEMCPMLWREASSS